MTTAPVPCGTTARANSGAVSIELEYAPEPDKIVDWVREAYQATDRLLRAAGLRG